MGIQTDSSAASRLEFRCECGNEVSGGTADTVTCDCGAVYAVTVTKIASTDGLLQ